MKLTDFVATPTPKKLIVDTPEVVAQYGEPLEFYILNPMPIEIYLKLSSLSTIEFIKEVLVKEDGTKAITDGSSLPGTLIPLVANVIWQDLGKLPGKN
jgi:hypothetical protein